MRNPALNSGDLGLKSPRMQSSEYSVAELSYSRDSAWLVSGLRDDWPNDVDCTVSMKVQALAADLFEKSEEVRKHVRLKD